MFGRSETEYARFLHLNGHRVRRGPSGFWYAESPGLGLAIPLDRVRDPTRRELWTVAIRLGAPILRYTTSTGSSTVRLVGCDRVDYDLSSLSGKARNQTRRGLERSTVLKVSWERLRRDGMDINRDTWMRQGRHFRFDQHYWQRLCKSGARVAAANAWGACLGDELAAYMVTLDITGTRHILLHMSRTRYLSEYINNALLYTVTMDAFGNGASLVSYGLSSVAAATGLDHFKSSMGFVQLNVHAHISVLRPFPAIIRLATSSFATPLLRRLSPDVPAKLKSLVATTG